MLTIILDLDGVLITTPPWKKDDMHVDGYSEFNRACVSRLNKILDNVSFEIWLSSTRRAGKTIIEFNRIFENRGLKGQISGYLPIIENCSRKEEVQHFIQQKKLSDYLIIDDDKSLNDLPFEIKKRTVLTEYMKGFDDEAYREAKIIIEKYL